MPTDTPAVVVGTCAHSLATIRALARNGVAVHVLGENLEHPAWGSRYGHFHKVESFAGDALVDALMDFQGIALPAVRPVLILTNDLMVQGVAARARDVAERYRLSWAAQADAIAGLTYKSGVEARCREVGLDFPRTMTISDMADLGRLDHGWDWPLIVKPNRPLSGFKTGIVRSLAELRDFIARQQRDLPVIVQEWIPGDDTAIYFSAAYFEGGRVLSRFDGHKLRSYPMGHTTIAEPFDDDEVHDTLCRFFAGMDLTGPASLEVKRRPDGRIAVIEPTVGRTDAWLDLCVANGVNLPMIEYRQQTRGSWLDLDRAVRGHLSASSSTKIDSWPRQSGSAVWVNAERDVLGLPWLLAHMAKASRPPRGIRFTYFDWSDPVPFLRAARITLRGLPRRLWIALVRRLAGRQ